jgi:hypothetical protein
MITYILFYINYSHLYSFIYIKVKYIKYKINILNAQTHVYF